MYVAKEANKTVQLYKFEDGKKTEIASVSGYHSHELFITKESIALLISNYRNLSSKIHFLDLYTTLTRMVIRCGTEEIFPL